jgi:adenosylcobyric acid synthase
VLGVVPWLDQTLPAEDSLSLLDRTPNRKKQADMTIAVVRLPRIANFTDFDPLEAEPSVRVVYLSPKDDLGYPDAVIIPGTKTTIADLLTLQRTGMADAIQNYVAAGGTVMGICGGFQMMGQFMADPEGIEGHEGRFPSPGFGAHADGDYPAKNCPPAHVTSRFPQEGLARVWLRTAPGPHPAQPVGAKEQTGYEFEFLFEDRSLGVVDSSQSLWGTYLHGIFDNGPWRRAWLNRLRQQRGSGIAPHGHPQLPRTARGLVNRNGFQGGAGLGIWGRGRFLLILPGFKALHPTLGAFGVGCWVWGWGWNHRDDSSVRFSTRGNIGPLHLSFFLWLQLGLPGWRQTILLVQGQFFV